jgi:hypothetical protein
MTDPIKTIIPREIASEDVSRILDQFSAGIEEIVNFGSHILGWDIEQAKGTDENLPVILMFRHILDLLDSLSILVKKSSIDPGKLILRSILETLLGLQYLLDTDTKERALNFLVWHYNKDLKVLKKLKPGEQAYMQFEKKLENDKTIIGMNPPHIPDIDTNIEILDKLLSNPLYSNAATEYQRLIMLGESNPPWYRFYNGPRNVEQLAGYLNENSLYEFLYRTWSGPTHGTDILTHKIAMPPTGGVGFIQLRFYKDAQIITQYAYNLGILAFTLMVDKRIINKKDEFWEWYHSIKDFFMRLNQEQFLNNE